MPLNVVLALISAGAMVTTAIAKECCTDDK